MIKEAHKRKKTTKIYTWQFQGRKMTIERYDHSPKSITFFGGVHIAVDKESYSLRAVSRLQKQLRQELYQWLVDDGLNSENYVLKIDAPEQPSGKKVYLELVMSFEPAERGNMKDLEDVFKRYIVMLDKLNKIGPS